MGFDDTAFQVVDIDARGNAAKELEHTDMRSGEALLVLGESEFHMLQATMRERCDKTVTDTHGSLEMIKEFAHHCIIDLNFLSRRDFDATGSKAGVQCELVDVDEPFEGAVTRSADQICVTLADNDESALGF